MSDVSTSESYLDRNMSPSAGSEGMWNYKYIALFSGLLWMTSMLQMKIKRTR